MKLILKSYNHKLLISQFILFQSLNNKSSKQKTLILPLKIFKSKHSSIATLRSPHVDKRGIDQFDSFIYKTIIDLNQFTNLNNYKLICSLILPGISATFINVIRSNLL